MNDAPLTPSFSSKLIEQDQSLQTSRYQEHRMQLELQLKRAEWKVRLTGRIVVAALLISLATMLICGSRVLGSPDPGDRDANVLSVTVGVIYAVSAIVFWLGLASYFSRFQPGVKRTRELLLEESIRELRQEVSELRKLLTGPSGKQD
jgi:hypothetical protein